MDISEIFDRTPVYQVLYILSLPLYFFLFTVVFRPETAVSLLGAEDFIVRVAVASTEMIVPLVCMRYLYRRLGHRVSIPLWFVLEIFAMSLALAFYVGFDVVVFARAVAYVSLVLALPFWAMYCRINLSFVRKKNADLSAGDKMRFYDAKGRLKIVLPAESVVYIQADDNYIRIYYLDEGVSRELVIRNSMSAVDELCQYHGFLRASRSYIVNPKHVTWMGIDDNDEAYAILDVEDMPNIPVTKRYIARLVEKLR